MRTIFPVAGRKTRLDTSLAIVNIVLLLIFFFLATGSIMNSPDFGVDLSETSELPIDMLPQPILIVAADGSLSLNGEPIASEDLAFALIDDPVLHLMMQRDAPASDLLEILGREDLFATEIRLVTIHAKPIVEEGGS